MPGQEFPHRLDDQVLGPIDRVNYQADEPGSRPD